MKVNENLSVSFGPEYSRPDNKGLVPITVRIRVFGNSKAEFYLGERICPTYWDNKEKRADVKSHPDKNMARTINNSITRCLAKIENDFLILRRYYDVFSAETLKAFYKGEFNPEKKEEKVEEKKPTLCQLLNFKYSKFASLVKAKKRSRNTLKRWATTKRKLRHFFNFKFKSWDICVTEVKYHHAEDFQHYLLTQDLLDENTARKYLKNAKELLQIAEDREIIFRNPWKRYKIGYEQPERKRLTMGQIITLYERPLIERLDHVRNIFLFACFTGYSFTEVLNLSRDCIFIGIDGKRWIKIDRQKTGNPECLPLLPIPGAIVDRYANDPYCLAKNKLLPVKNYHNYNGYLKEVAYICELSIELSTNIARHTFATTVCLDHDVPFETVSKLLGHKSLRTTKIYAQITEKKISNNMTELERKLFTSDGKLKVEVIPLNALQYRTTSIAV